jgi:hypothetical protein
MFAAIRTTAVVSLCAMLTACLLPAAATAQTRGSMPTAQAARPSGLRNSFAPNRPNVSSLSTRSSGAGWLGLGLIGAVPGSGAPAGDGGSQSGGGGSQGGGSEAQPKQNEGHQPAPYVGPFDLPEDSKRGSALASLRVYRGGLKWPIGLEKMEPEEAMTELREQMDGVVEAILRQPANEPAAPEIVKSGLRGIEQFARRFEAVAHDSPLSRTQEKVARMFLKNVYAALKAMEQPTTQAEVKTEK